MDETVQRAYQTLEKIAGKKKDVFQETEGMGAEELGKSMVIAGRELSDYVAFSGSEQEDRGKPGKWANRLRSKLKGKIDDLLGGGDSG